MRWFEVEGTFLTEIMSIFKRGTFIEGSANLLHSISDYFWATSHLHIVAIFKKKRHKQDGTMKLRGELGYLPKTPDHQTKYVTPQFSQFFIPSYPLVYTVACFWAGAVTLLIPGT